MPLPLHIMKNKVFNLLILPYIVFGILSCHDKNSPYVEGNTPDIPEQNDNKEDSNENCGDKLFTPWINTEACEIGGNNAREVALSMGVGWNLGNQMDAFSNGVASETCWGNPIATQQLFDTLKSKGFSTVRIPVTWMGHIGEAPAYPIDAEWLSRVKEIVEMAENAGLNAIINMHHDGADSKHWLNIKEAASNANKNGEIK